MLSISTPSGVKEYSFVPEIVADELYMMVWLWTIEQATLAFGRNSMKKAPGILQGVHTVGESIS